MKTNFQVLLLLVALCLSCEEARMEMDDNETPAVSLVSSNLRFSERASNLRTYVGLSGLDIPAIRMQHDVNAYKIEYATTYKGQNITASGMVLVPETIEPVPVLSYHHGTIASNAEAPTELNASAYEMILYQSLASAGFLVVVSDYIGFGSSLGIPHPYYVEELTTSAIADNLRAAKNLANELDVQITEKLYLAGYSQGGYATMATHKYLQQNQDDNWRIAASFAGSGGYDVKGTKDFFFEQEVYHQPFFIAYVAHAYKETLDLDIELNDYFNEPYASAIPDYFNGTMPGGEINDHLNDTLNILLKAEFLSSTDMDPQYRPLNIALLENSPVDWKPSAPLFLYHGDADHSLPFNNSVETYNKLIANGASTSLVTLTNLSGADHRSGYMRFVEEFMNKLFDLEKASVK